MREGDLVAGRYRLLRRIGAGAMGTVWAVRHELLGRDLALKICGEGESPARKAARDLFLREVRTVARLRHPNVVEIEDAGEVGRDGLYLAMELLEGESLAESLAAGPLSPGDALAVAAEICRGLSAAHGAGVIHRDLKPENVFLARGPGGGVVPKLLDFGVASAANITVPPPRSAETSPATQPGEKPLRATSTSAFRGVMGTPAYMSPEQALGEDGTDARTDVWALGVVLYEMLTGRLPFEAETYPALLPKIIEQPYPPLPASIPAEVRVVVAGCLAKDRGDRYASAEVLLQAIERARASLPTSEPTSVRSGFFVETGRGTAETGRGVAPVQAPAAPRAPGTRIGLALAILALPVVIGVAAIVGRRAGPPAVTVGPPASPAAQPPPEPAAPVTMGEPPRPVPSVTTSAAAPPAAASSAVAVGSPTARPGKAPPMRQGGGKSRVTQVTNAGF